MDVRFLAVRSGKVHVLPPVVEGEWGEWRRIGDGPPDPIATLLGDQRVLCGRVVSRHRGGFEAYAHPVSSFPDERLCASCYRAVPEDERASLFEHPVDA